MKRMNSGWLLVLTMIAIVSYATWRDAQTSPGVEPPVGAPGGRVSTPDGLRQTIADMENRLRDEPGDAGAAVTLADALLRQARLTENGAFAVRAEQALTRVLAEYPDDYEATRMLATVLASEHRFQEAIGVASRARGMRPEDAWNYGTIGDSLLELGDRAKAFDAFDTMMRLKPTAASYARVSYARELQGDLDGAIAAMRMASEATSAHDPEGQAWYRVHLGQLYAKQGRLDDARRELRHADFLFPRHPLAMAALKQIAESKDPGRND